MSFQISPCHFTLQFLQNNQKIYNIQMNIQTYNKALFEQSKKALHLSFTMDIDATYEQLYFGNDTDTVRYTLVARRHNLKLIFVVQDLDNLWNYCGDYFRKHYYEHFHIKKGTASGKSCLEIILDNEGLTKVNNSFKEKQKTGIVSQGHKFDAVFDFISKKLASIKRHFLACPFEMMLQTIAHNHQTKGNASLNNFSFYTKSNHNQKIWLAFQKNQFTVYYGVTFEDRFEQQLAKIYFSELIDAKKHVQNSPGVTVSDSQIPKSLIESFPNQKNSKYNFGNGIISITLFGSLVRNHRAMATYLACFRNYAYYHVQAWKCYLHARVLRRINIIYRDLKHAKIQPFADK